MKNKKTKSKMQKILRDEPLKTQKYHIWYYKLTIEINILTMFLLQIKKILNSG